MLYGERLESQVELLQDQVQLIQEQLVNLLSDMRQLRRSNYNSGFPSTFATFPSGDVPQNVDSNPFAPVDQLLTTTTINESEKDKEPTNNITTTTTTSHSNRDVLSNSKKEERSDLEDSADELRRRRILRFSTDHSIAKQDS